MKRNPILGVILICTITALVVFGIYVLNLYIKIDATAAHYTSYRDDGKGEGDILDIEFINIDTNNIKSITLEELTLNKGCDLESPNGSNVESVEKEVTIKPGMYSILKMKDKIILRFNNHDLPFLDCYNLYSGKVEIIFKNNRKNATKRFNISNEQFEYGGILKIN